MKKLAIGIVVFLATFGLGYLVVPQYKVNLITREFRAETVDRSSVCEIPLPPLTFLPQETNFDPEFRDLPNFGDVIYAESGGKLIEIIDDRIYRRSEVVAKSGEKWLVLFEQYGKYRLKESIASVKNLKSVSWPGEERDARLAFNGTGNPVIAVKNIQGLRPGKVNTLFHRPLWEDISESDFQEQELDDGFRREFRLSETMYVLRVSKGLTRDGTEVAVLVLESNGVSQAIKQTYHVPSDDRDIVGSLLWAGDLDGDGKLDLYFDEFNEKGFTATELHLSSLAESGELVGWAASSGMAGC